MDLPISSKYRSRPNDPVPDAERQQLSAQLNDAFAAGDLGQEEFDRLLETIFAAKTLGDLVPAVLALGKPDTYAEPEIVRQSGNLAPGELSTTRTPGSSIQMWAVGGLVGAGALLLLIVLLLVFV